MCTTYFNNQHLCILYLWFCVTLTLIGIIYVNNVDQLIFAMAMRCVSTHHRFDFDRLNLISELLLVPW
jgi:hypothetical protein